MKKPIARARWEEVQMRSEALELGSELGRKFRELVHPNHISDPCVAMVELHLGGVGESIPQPQAHIGLTEVVSLVRPVADHEEVFASAEPATRHELSH